jgi:hypothetical protein
MMKGGNLFEATAFKDQEYLYDFIARNVMSVNNGTCL